MKHIKTFEQYANTDLSKSELTNEELFGFGKKKINLNNVKPSRAALDFLNDSKRKQVIATYKAAFAKQGLSEDLVRNAIIAVYDFADGIPMLSKYNLEFNQETSELSIDPNGKGLFNGHPMMG